MFETHAKSSYVNTLAWQRMLCGQECALFYLSSAMFDYRLQKINDYFEGVRICEMKESVPGGHTHSLTFIGMPWNYVCGS